MANAAAVVARLEQTLHDCYVAALAEEPETAKQATLTLHLHLDAAGKVRKLSVEGQEATLDAAVRCAASQIKRQAEFEPPVGGRATVSFEVRLERLE